MTETCSNATAKPHLGEVAYGYWETLCAALRESGLQVSYNCLVNHAVSVEQYLSAFKDGLEAVPAFGLKVGQEVTLKTFPVLGMTLLSCHHLGQALEQILRYESLNHDLGRSSLVIEKERCRFVWSANPRFVPVEDGRMSFELALSVFAGMSRFAPFILQNRLPIERIGFAAESTQAAREIEQFFQCSVCYGQEQNSIEVSPDVLDWPLMFADPTTFSALTAHADALLTEDHQDIELVRRVQEFMPDALRKQAFRIEDLASALDMSPRSLQRKLKEYGYSFQNLLDETRLKLAKGYLQDNQLAMSEIAFLIGYQEQSSFNHAFKNWTGQSPRDFRAKEQRLVKH